MKKWWNDLSITYKIFSITIAMLMIMSSLMYSIIYFYLPTVYHNYKAKLVDNESKKISQRLSNDLSYLEDWRINLRNYARAKNIDIEVYNSNANNIFDSKEMYDYINGDTYINGVKTIPEKVYTLSIPVQENIINDNKNIKYSINSFEFSDSNSEYLVQVTSHLQQIDEVSTVIVQLIPQIFLIVIIISSVSAIVYSKIITTPMIKINKATKKIAKLDFSDELEHDTGDEIGELSRNINLLSKNLDLSLTNLKKANKKLKIDIEKEREMEEQRRDFIAAISHELKTPLTAIKGQIEGMIYNIGIYKDRDKYLKKSYEISEEMEKLIYQMVDISKTQSFNYKVQKKRVNISKTCDEILLSNDFLIKSKEMKIVNNTNNTIVELDGILFKKALDNIISNAIHYSPENSQLKISSYIEKGILLRVENTNVTIDEKDLPNLFDPFFRIDKSRNRKSGGSGLGLYIVKNTIELNNLEIKIYNGINSVITDISMPIKYL